tara:strand:+ start:514 stop:2169 length:1656 start_codon:yes stop_codon:yes gene_type:complete
MASVLARAAVGANDALQKMLESKRKAVLEQQRANEVRQQQQDLKAYRSQTIQEGQARIQQQRDAADDLAQYRKDSLIQTEGLAGQARGHAATLAEERRNFEAHQNKLAIAGRISERELIEEGLNSRNQLDYVQRMILENTHTNPVTGEATQNFNQADVDGWIYEASTIGKEYAVTPSVVPGTVGPGQGQMRMKPGYLDLLQGRGIPSAISEDILGDADIERLVDDNILGDEESPPPRPLSPTGGFSTRREEPYQPSPDLMGQLSPTGGFNTRREASLQPLSPTGGFNVRREAPYQPSPELMGLPSATGPSAFEPLPISPRPLSPTGGFNVRREAPIQPSPGLPGQDYLDLLRGTGETVPAGQPSPVQADPFGGLTQEAALQQITGLTQAPEEMAGPRQAGPSWQLSPNPQPTVSESRQERYGAGNVFRTPLFSRPPGMSYGEAKRIRADRASTSMRRQERRERIDELLAWEADLLSGKRSGNPFFPGHQGIRSEIVYPFKSSYEEKKKIREEAALRAVRQEIDDLRNSSRPDADLMPTPFDVNGLTAIPGF